MLGVETATFAVACVAGKLKVTTGDAVDATTAEVLVCGLSV